MVGTAWGWLLSAAAVASFVSCFGARAGERPEVLVLGDSIRMAWQGEVAGRVGGRAAVVGSTENGGASGALLRDLDNHVAGRNPAVVVFNAGLGDVLRHPDGRPATDERTYGANLEQLVIALRARFPGVRLLFVETTPVDEASAPRNADGRPRRANADIDRYNEIARETMAGLSVPVCAVNAAFPRAESKAFFPDYGTSLTPAGRAKAADLIAPAILKALDGDAAPAAKPAPVPAGGGGNLPEVLLLGDSIRMLYQKEAAEALAGVARVRFPEDNGKDTVNFLASLERWSALGRPRVVHFNVGLHDIFLRPDGTPARSPEAYGQNLEQIVERLKALFPEAVLVFATTTPVDEKRQAASATYGRVVRRNADVAACNRLALAVMRRHGVAVNDLHAFMTEQGADALLDDDGIHENARGRKVLGARVAEAVRNALP